MSLTVFKVGHSFFDFECIRVAKSDFKQFGGCISPLFFLSVILEIFYIKPPGVFTKLHKQSLVGV